MKRHESLHPLSRDHHEGLLAAREMDDAAAGGPDARRRAVAGFARLWNAWLESSFDEALRTVAPLAANAEDGERMRRGTEELRAAARRIVAAAEADPGEEAVRRFARLLHDEIRWQQREMFPRLEASAGPERLAALGDRWLVVEATRPRRRDSGTCEPS